jgi:formamidopyrimidine-DNA glycosylase
MPEGAEVKIIGEGLAKSVTGKEISAIVPVSGRYKKRPIPGYSEHLFRDSQKVVGVGVKGKFIYWLLENNSFIFNTLGMSGHWSFEERKTTRVRFDFDDGSAAFFNDVRNFGTLKVVTGKSSLIQKLESIGPDMLSEDVSDELFSFCIKTQKSKTICEALMNQSVISGVGNYVKAESLYRAKISPNRACSSLTDEELSTLNFCVKSVLKAAYEINGATLRDYKNTSGARGEASSFFLVYGKKVDLEGNEVVREETKDGRTTHWVPSVQR